MKPSEWFEYFSLLHGANPRPQPWQMNLVDRIWARRIEESKQKPSSNTVDVTYPRHEPMKVQPFLMSTNWGSGYRWFYEWWMRTIAGENPFQEFVVHEVSPSKMETFAIHADRKGMVVVLKSRSVGCSWNPPPKQRGWSGMVTLDEIRRDVKDERISDREAAVKLTMHAITGATNCTPDPEPPAPKKRAREPFYGKFLPKRRLQ